MLASLIPASGGHGGNGPPPDEFIYGLIGAGVLLGVGLVWVAVNSFMEGPRSRRRCARVLASGLRARARVILLVERAPGTYTLTLEVAATPGFVAKSLATVPLSIVPSIQVGTELVVRYDPAVHANVVIEDPRIECHLF